MRKSSPHLVTGGHLAKRRAPAVSPEQEGHRSEVTVTKQEMGIPAAAGRGRESRSPPAKTG